MIFHSGVENVCNRETKSRIRRTIQPDRQNKEPPFRRLFSMLQISRSARNFFEQLLIDVKIRVDVLHVIVFL
jgi:hypothetical protein